MSYKDYNIGDWIGHISGAIEDERELDCNEMRDLVEFLTKQKSAIKALEQEPKTGHWIPVSKDLPKDFGTYLITLESGDVCKCEFNPDFIDEEHENGAFTYYHQYFDPATLGLIDGEDEAVDAIAWMPFEPYEPQEGSEVGTSKSLPERGEE